MGKIQKFLIIFFLIIILIYVTSITSFPDNIIIFQGEKLNLKTIYGLSLKEKEGVNYEAIETSANIANSKIDNSKIGKIDMKLNLFKDIPVRDVTVNVIPKTKVIPLGNLVGLKLYTNGVLIVGMSEINGIDKRKYKPYENSGMEEGDMIISINEKAITCTAELIKNVNNCKGENIKVKYVREGKEFETSIKPVETEQDKYKLGLWVRDAAAGVGTMSFYEKSSGMFASLGHGILDIDTEKLIDIAKGEFVESNIVSVTKGEKGNPGKIQGSIENKTAIGEVYKNTEFGVYGKIKNSLNLNIDYSNELEVASREEIKTGEAKIICTLENNKKQEYLIEIQKIYLNNNSDNKSMVLKITDSKLLEKTGGIIQRYEWCSNNTK